MKIFIIFALIINLISCQKKMSSSETVSAEPVISDSERRLKSLISEFESKYAIQVSYSVSLDNNVKTGQSNSSDVVIGLCEMWASGNKFVYINNDWFSSQEITDIQRKILVYHELAHCSMNRIHDTRLYNDGMPYSLMYPVINQIVPFYSSFESYYLKELPDGAISGNDPSLYKLKSLNQDFIIKSYNFLNNFKCD